MLQKLIIFILLFLAVIAEISLLPHFFGQNKAPQLILVMIVFWSARRAINLGWVLFFSMILDLMTFERPGFSAISFILISYGVGFLAKRFFVSQKSRVFFSVAFFVVISTIFHYMYLNFFGNVIEQLFDKEMIFSLDFFEIPGLLAIIGSNLAIFSLIYWPLKKMKNIFPIEEMKLSLR